MLIKLIKAINSLDDRELFTEDMNAVTEWAAKNKMELNKLKYQLLQYGKSENLKLPYKIDNDTEVKNSDAVKDLGVLMSSNLEFSDQILAIKNKAKKVSTWILRIVESRSAETILLLYKTYVRPHLEYSCSLWSPHEIQHIASLESVQRSVTARIEGMEQLNYWDRLKALNLYSLQRRRERYDIIHLWKTQQNIIPNDLNLNFYYNERQGWKCRRSIIQNRQRKLSTIHNNSFSSRAAAIFNTLPKSVKSATSLSSFKSRLDKHLKRIPDCPPVHGYVRMNNNSLLDWANSKWEEEMVTLPGGRDSGDVSMYLLGTGEELPLPDHML